MSLKCKGCGKSNIAQGSDAELCLYCRSKLTHCKIDAKGYKEIPNINVEWCFEKDCRILHANCHECEHYSENKILPEVE